MELRVYEDSSAYGMEDAPSMLLDTAAPLGDTEETRL